MKWTRMALLQSALILVGASALNGQDLAEICPNSDAATGAVVGIVSDVDARMALPGATVRATWDEGGIPGQAEIQTGLDGSFTMCYLPRETDLSLQAMLGAIAGQALELTLTEAVTHQDIGFSLTGSTGDNGSGKDRIWACLGSTGSQIRVQMASLMRCEPTWQPLEGCPKEELGKVSASVGTRGRGALKEMMATLVDAARQLGANALTEFHTSRGSVSAQAVKIEVDPSTC